MQIIGKDLKNTHTFDCGRFHLYTDFVIVEISEGAHITVDTMLSFFHFFNETYKAPYGYISYRKNSYSIDPQVYRMIPQNNLLKGIAVVSNRKFSSLNAHVEKGFYKGHYELFTTLETAVNWLDTIIPLDKNYIGNEKNAV